MIKITSHVKSLSNKLPARLRVWVAVAEAVWVHVIFYRKMLCLKDMKSKKGPELTNLNQ